MGIEFAGNSSEGATGAIHVGNKYKTGGGNIGVGAGWFGTSTWTIIFNPPPAEIWCRPGSKR